MTVEQLRFVGRWAARVDGAAGVAVEDLGRGHFRVVVWDKTNVDVGSRKVLPSDNDL